MSDSMRWVMRHRDYERHDTVSTGNTVTTDDSEQNTHINMATAWVWSRIQGAEYTYERHRDYRWCNTVSTSDMMTIDDTKQNTHVCMKTDRNRYIVCRLKNRMSLCCVWIVFSLYFLDLADRWSENSLTDTWDHVRLCFDFERVTFWSCILLELTSALSSRL